MQKILKFYRKRIKFAQKTKLYFYSQKYVNIFDTKKLSALNTNKICIQVQKLIKCKRFVFKIF